MVDSTVICNQRGEWVAVGGPESGVSLTITAARRDAASDHPTLQEHMERAGTLVVAFLDLLMGPEPPRRASEEVSLPKDLPASPRPRQAVLVRAALMKDDQPGTSSHRLPVAPSNLGGSAENSARAGGTQGSSIAAPSAGRLDALDPGGRSAGRERALFVA